MQATIAKTPTANDRNMTLRERYKHYARENNEKCCACYYVKPFHGYYIVHYATRRRYLGFASVPFASRTDALNEAIRLNAHSLRYYGYLD